MPWGITHPNGDAYDDDGGTAVEVEEVSCCCVGPSIIASSSDERSEVNEERWKYCCNVSSTMEFSTIITIVDRDDEEERSDLDIVRATTGLLILAHAPTSCFWKNEESFFYWHLACSSEKRYKYDVHVGAEGDKDTYKDIWIRLCKAARRTEDWEADLGWGNETSLQLWRCTNRLAMKLFGYAVATLRHAHANNMIYEQKHHWWFLCSRHKLFVFVITLHQTLVLPHLHR